jgi:hypothetical protein
MQHTPKPDAQLPSIVPPLDVHSEDVKHVPFMVTSDFPLHWEFLKVTTEKMEKALSFSDVSGWFPSRSIAMGLLSSFDEPAAARQTNRMYIFILTIPRGEIKCT